MSLAKIYEELCKKADGLLQKHNPCRWDAVNKDCARGTQGCCNGCELLSESGCTINSLSCKLWVCPCISDTLPEDTRREFVRLWDVAQEYNLLTFRGGAAESIRNAKFPNASRRKYASVSKYGEITHIFLSDRERKRDD